MNKVPDDDYYFMDVSDDLLDFLEKQGEENIKELLKFNTENQENGQKLLNWLLIAAGSSFALLIQKPYAGAIWAFFVILCVYWSICGMLLAYHVLPLGNRVLISSPPNVLYPKNYKEFNAVGFDELRRNKGYSGGDNVLSVLRRYRLKNLSRAAEEFRGMVAKIDFWLHWVRRLSIFVPILAITGAAIVYVLTGYHF